MSQSDRTHRSSGYGYESLTHLTEAQGTGMEVLQSSKKFRVRNPPKFRVGIRILYPYPGYCGTGVQKIRKFRVRVWMSYVTHRSSGYGYECRAEHTEVPARVVPGKIPRVWFCTYLTEHKLAIFTDFFVADRPQTGAASTVCHCACLAGLLAVASISRNT